MGKNFHGVNIAPKYLPELDPDFIAFPVFIEEFLKTAHEPFAIAAEREGEQIQVFDTFIHGTDEMAEADLIFAERITKFLLYARGAFRIYVCGNKKIYESLKQIYSAEGARAFDFNFMQTTYGCPMEVIWREYADKPAEYQNSEPIGRHLDGCRIGFDAGGSDRKVSAVINGETVFSDETVWFPKLEKDASYHRAGIADSMRRAAACMPRVDAIGVSSAGVFIENKAKVTSLFMSLSPEDKIKNENIYMEVAAELFPGVPCVVANDGDVTALAGAMSLEKNNVFGIAMGTSEAAGYVDANGSVTGWLNELAFVPVDLNPNAMADEWSGDIGCGVKYLSQDSVIKLAPAAGIELDESLSPAEKLKVVQGLMEAGDPRAKKIYESIGVYLAYILKLYSLFYTIDEVLLLGRVMSGTGGNIVLEKTKEVLADACPELKFNVSLPDEKARRVGQSVAAASLPVIR